MTDVNTEEEILEPTPYENAYRRTLMDDDPTPETPDPELLDINDGDTQESEGLINAQDTKEHDWKKRYSDLKSYHDRKHNEWVQQQELIEAKLKLAQQQASAPKNLPKSAQELEDFKYTHEEAERLERGIFDKLDTFYTYDLEELKEEAEVLQGKIQEAIDKFINTFNLKDEV